MRFLLCAALAACATPTMSTMPDNKQTIRDLYADINVGQLDRLATAVAADYEAPTGERGPAAFVANVRDLRAGFPDIQFTLDDVLAEADRVVVRWHWAATHGGPFRGIAATHQRVTNSGIAIYQLAGGKVVRNWLETDRLGALQQLGALPRR